MTEEILFSRENHIGLVKLNRPQALNALTLHMILALQNQLRVWEDDTNIHAVIVQSEGGRAFCAGGDVRAIYHHGRENIQKKMAFFGHEYRLNEYIHDFGKPYIALMDGITMGGGVGISLHGSHPVASERFVFAMPETGIGFYPDIGASHILSRCPGYFGIYLGLTGSRLGAVDAQALGLVKHLIPSDRFTDVLTSLVEADLSTDAHQRVSDVLYQFIMPVSPAPISELAPVVHACFQHRNIESILGSLENKGDDWCQETLRVLAKKAPLSLKVTVAQLRKAELMTMAECLQMDYCLTHHFMCAPDFHEGVRALLVDKDNLPHWHPETLADVTDDRVAACFEMFD